MGKHPEYESEFFVPPEREKENGNFLVLKENSKVLKDYKENGELILSATYTVPETFMKLFDYIYKQKIFEKDKFLDEIGLKRLQSANWAKGGKYFKNDVERVTHSDLFLSTFDDDLLSTIEEKITEADYVSLDAFFSSREDGQFANMLKELKRINDLPNSAEKTVVETSKIALTDLTLGDIDDDFFSKIKNELQKSEYTNAIKILRDKIKKFIPTAISYIDLKNFFVNNVFHMPVFSKNTKNSTQHWVYNNFDEFNEKKKEWIKGVGGYIEELLKKNPLLEEDLRIKKVGNEIEDIYLNVDFFIDFLDYNQTEFSKKISELKEKFAFVLNYVRGNLVKDDLKQKWDAEVKKAEEVLDILSSDLFKGYSNTAMNSRRGFYEKVPGNFNNFFQTVEKVLKENEKSCGNTLVNSKGLTFNT